MTRANKRFVLQLKQVKRGLLRRFGKDICKELHNDCYACRISIMIGEINSLIDLLED